jgi:hypothetical protein
MCVVNGKALKPDKMQTEDDEPKAGALGADRVLRQKKHPMEKFLEDAESSLNTPQPKERPRQRGGARSAPESPVAIRVKQLLLVSLAASVKAPTDAAASANVDLHSQVSETASELAPAGTSIASTATRLRAAPSAALFTPRQVSHFSTASSTVVTHPSAGRPL